MQETASVSKMPKVVTIILDVFFTLIIILAAVITVMSFNSNSKGVSNINGVIPLAIQSGSMAKTLNTGDLIISKEIENYDDLKVGDIISFFSKEDEQTIIKTHRITEIYEDEGFPVYVTKGDANDTEDDVTVAQANIISIYSGKKIPILGYVITFLKSSFGFILCIVIPLLCLFIYSLYNFVVLILEQKKNEMFEQFKKRESAEKKDNNEDEIELPRMR